MLKCPSCKLLKLQEITLASNPPRYEYWCPYCGWGLRYFQRDNSFVKLTDKERIKGKEKRMNDSVFNVVITNKCNAHCPYCISKQTPEVCKDYSKFNYAKLQKAIQYAVRAEIQTCKLTGKNGDPIVDLKTLHHVLSFVRDKFPIIEVQTNGTLLTEDIVKDLAGAGVTIIAVSCVDCSWEGNCCLYGVDYPELFNLVNLLHKYDLSVRLSCTLIKDFVSCPEDIDAFLDYFQKCNVEQFSFIPVGYFGNNKYAQWSREHQVDKHIWDRIHNQGTLLWETPYGGKIYDYKGNNVYIAECLSGTVKGIRSLIYYPDGHLRYSWTRPGAIIF